MKALVLNAYSRFDYEDMETPALGPTDVLVQVKAVGICGSDVHGMDGSTGRRQPPLVMGHEASGIIHETGTAVTQWQKGRLEVVGPAGMDAIKIIPPILR